MKGKGEADVGERDVAGTKRLKPGDSRHATLNSMVTSWLETAVRRTQVGSPEPGVTSFQTQGASMPWAVLDLDDEGRWRLLFPAESDLLTSVLDELDFEYSLDQDETGTFCSLFFSSLRDVQRLTQLSRSVFVAADELVRKLDA